MQQNSAKESVKRKPVQLNPKIHKELAIEARKRDLKISEYANVLLARGLGLVDTDVDEPEAEPVFETAA